MNGKEYYEARKTYRDSWITDAEESEALTLPGLRVRGHQWQHGKNLTRTATNTQHRYTSVGRDGVNTLANTLLTLLFPLDIRWFRLTLDEDQKEQLIEAGVFEAEADIDEALRDIEDRMLEKMEQTGLRPFLHSLFRRNLVEGNDVIQLVINEDGTPSLRLVPLRSFVCSRTNGRVTKLVIEDTTESKDGTSHGLYTTVDFKEGKVYQFEDFANRTNDKEVNDRTSFYAVVTSNVPYIEDYADSYVYELLGDLTLHSQLSKDVAAQQAINAKQVIANDSETSGINSYDLANLEAGDCIEATVTPDGRIAGIGWLSTAVANNNQDPVIRWMNDIENRLVKQFAGMLASISENFTQPRTASEIQRIASELDTFAAGLGQVYNQNLQLPLAQMFLDLVQLENNADGETPIRPTIVAGNSQLSRLQELSKLLQVIGNMLTYNPDFASQIKWRELWDRMTNSLGLDTQDILKSEEELQQEQHQQQQALQLQQAEQIREQQLQALRQQRISDNREDVA